jgi:hypothetical protein
MHTLHAPPPTRHRLRTGLIAVAAFAVAGLAALTAPAPVIASAGPAAADSSREPYLGRWNYDQPDRDSMRNIGILRCPSGSTECDGPGPNGGPLEVPQIGDIVFTEGPDGDVVGRTDVGCTWHFAERSGSLELSSETQYCFNEVNGVRYTILDWSVTVDGNHQHEVITALSHRPGSGDYEFVVEHGRRTRVPEAGPPGAAQRFVGIWEYTPADEEAQINMIRTREVGPEGERSTETQQTGFVTFTAAPDGTVVAQTADGCQWGLLVRGYTASLAPETQTCTLADATITQSDWTIASDGRHQASRLRGVKKTGATTESFLLQIGDLARSR